MEVLDYINNPDKKYQSEVLRVIYDRSEEVLKLRDQARIESRAMEIVALFIREHDLFRETIERLKHIKSDVQSARV